MVAHLVVFRPGLWRQTVGDEEESSALQFRVPTEHLRLTKHESLSVCIFFVCVCVLMFSIFWGMHCLCSCR